MPRRPSSALGWFWAIAAVSGVVAVIFLAHAIHESTRNSGRSHNAIDRSPSVASTDRSAPQTSLDPVPPQRPTFSSRPPSTPPAVRPSLRPSLTPTPPHVRLTPEGKWQPEFGYVWVDQNSDDLDVRWVPGLKHPFHPNVVSAREPGKLAAASGYRFKSQDEGDYVVVPVRTAPTEDEQAAAITKIVIALFSQGIMEYESDPDADFFEQLGDEIGRGLAREVRDAAIRGALTDLFPAARPSALDAAANFILLAADDELTASQLVAATTYDALVRDLRSVDPESADAEFMARFLLRVAEACEARR